MCIVHGDPISVRLSARSVATTAKKAPKTDWHAFDAMSEEERHQVALSAPPANRGTARGGLALCLRCETSAGRFVLYDVAIEAKLAIN
jgi:hypothetical protein